MRELRVVVRSGWWEWPWYRSPVALLEEQQLFIDGVDLHVVLALDLVQRRFFWTQIINDVLR